MADRVMMIGPIAPPQGGVSTLFQTLLDSDLKNRYRVSIFNTNKYRVKKRYRFSTDRVRITSFFELAIQMILLNFSLHKEKPTIIHIQSCKSSFLRDSMFIIISRFWRKKVVLHFHSFSVISG